jgi:hypothetical protein
MTPDAAVLMVLASTRVTKIATKLLTMMIYRVKGFGFGFQGFRV